MDILIRNIQREDIPDVARIKIDGWKSAYKDIISQDFLNDLEKQYDDMLKKMEGYCQNDGFILAESNGQVVGYCRYDSNIPKTTDADCELKCLYIRPDLKRSGIGTKLFQYTTDDLKKKGKKKMILWCFSYIEPSIKFYTKMGGKIIAERYREIDGVKYKESCFMYEL